jgi:homoisocitrate dehydrogenase
MNLTSADFASAAPPLRLLVLPGDGIGREVIPAALEVLRATGLPLEFVQGEAGWECFQRHAASLPDETLAQARAADAILFGAVSSPSYAVEGYRSPIVALRRALDLYANIRPVRGGWEMGDGRWGRATIPHPASPIPQVDLVVVRENTEGLYVGQETSDGEIAVARRVITRRASERIARAAFELARSRGEARDLRLEARAVEQASSLSPRVTIVHKANVLRETCGLFRAAALRVAEQYPDVAADEQLVDSAALQLVQRPERFDVIVTTNMFGDILSDVASFWCGGLGMASSANIGDERALFEPVHGSAPDIAGKGLANPLAAIGCAAMLLEYAAGRATQAAGSPAGEYRTWAARIRSSIQATLRSEIRTPDLGGQSTTEEVTNAVIAALTRDG